MFNENDFCAKLKEIPYIEINDREFGNENNEDIQFDGKYYINSKIFLV